MGAGIDSNNIGMRRPTKETADAAAKLIRLGAKPRCEPSPVLAALNPLLLAAKHLLALVGPGIDYRQILQRRT